MKYIGNCDVIDWNQLVDQLKSADGKVLTYKPSGNALDLQWQLAGYQHNDPAIEWIQYWAGQCFETSIADVFGEWVGAKPYYTFVSRIRVGKFIPFHEDVMSTQHEIPGSPVRYTCYMSGAVPGHIGLVEDTVISMPQVGDVWQWPSPSSQHSGVNVSDCDKWQFNFWGYR
jgi:hypothetical protein